MIPWGGGVLGHECIYLSAQLLCLPPPVCLQVHVYFSAEVRYECLVLHRILACVDYCIYNPPHACQDPRIILCFPRLRFWYRPPEIRENSILSHQGGQGLERDPCVPPEALCVFTQGVAVEAPRDCVLI